MPNLVIGSTFKPFSYDELVKPLLQQTLAQQEFETQYSTLSENTDVWENMLNKQADKQAYAMYSNYNKDLNGAVDELASNGLNQSSRQALLRMKKRYKGEITPIEQAYAKRLEETKRQRDAYDKDKSIMFNRAAGTTSLDDYLNNTVQEYQQISGDELTKRSGLMASTLMKTIQNEPKYKSILGGQYFQSMIKSGYTPEEVAATIMMDKNAPKELRQIFDTVYNESGLSSFDAQSQNRGRDYIAAGLYNAIGSAQYSTMQNQDHMTPMQSAQLELERERLDLSKKQLDNTEEKLLGIELPDGSHVRPIGGGKVMKTYPDGTVEILSAAKESSIQSLTKPGAGTKPIIIARINDKWRIGEEGEDVEGTGWGFTRSRLVSGWGNYSLDAMNPKDIVTDYSTIPREAKDLIVRNAEKNNLDLGLYNIVQVKADSERAAGDYDYVLIPKSSDIFKKTMDTTTPTPTTNSTGHSKEQQDSIEDVILNNM